TGGPGSGAHRHGIPGRGRCRVQGAPCLRLPQTATATKRGDVTVPGKYSHLLSPLTVGRHTLKNRVIMGSMHTRLEHMDRPVERETAFYAERARGGTALLITAGYSPNEEGRLEEGAHVFNSPDQIPDHRAVT